MDQKSIQVIELLEQLEEILLDSLRIPFSSNRLVNEQEVIEIISDIKESIPTELISASKIVKERTAYIEAAKKEASDRIELGKRQQMELVDKFSVRQEAERQVADLRLAAKQQTDKLLRDATHKASVIEHDMQVKLAQLEQNYAVRRSSLEKELNERRQQYEQQNIDYNIRLQKQQTENAANGIKQLEAIKAECIKMENQSKRDAEAIKHESLNYQQQVNDHCEQKLNDTRSEASLIYEGANRYAHQTLLDLESKVNEINQVINAGKNELSKIQNLRKTNHNEANSSKSPNTIPFQKAKNTASKIKQKLSSNF